jgi:glutamyl-tRNA synthetase
LGRAMLEGTIDALERLTSWEATVLHETVARVGEANGLALRKAQAPVRCAVTGTLVGPPLFESLEVLGRARTIQRLRAALARAA